MRSKPTRMSRGRLAVSVLLAAIAIIFLPPAFAADGKSPAPGGPGDVACHHAGEGR